MTTYIYTLKLENDKYYIGKTTQTTDINFIKYFNNHNNQGCEWTRLHRPIEIIDVYESKSYFDINNTTKENMMKYKIENVRGGSYTKVLLDDWEIKSLEQEFNKIKDKDCDKKYTDYINLFNTKEDLEKEINIMEKYIMTVKNFTNMFKYISLNKVEINNRNRNDIIDKNNNIKSEISLNLLTNDIFNGPNYKNHISTINHILKNIKDISFTYKIGDSNEIDNTNLKIKICKIYLESQIIENKFIEELNDEHKLIFKNNNCDNIYELIKDELYTKLELLLEKRVNLK